MNIAIIKAGGVGTRMGASIPKQFVNVNDKPVIIYTLEAFQRHPNIDQIVVVCVNGWHDNLRSYAQKYGITKLVKIVEGGETSLKSIKNGVDSLGDDYDENDVVLIHDANRPLVSEEIISSVLAESSKHGMAVAAIPCNDEIAIINEDGNSSDRFADHKQYRRIQTPDAYQLKTLRSIYNSATEEQLTKLGATNVLAINMGYTMYFALGSDVNIRLTTQEDIELFEALLRTR